MAALIKTCRSQTRSAVRRRAFQSPEELPYGWTWVSNMTTIIRGSQQLGKGAWAPLPLGRWGSLGFYKELWRLALVRRVTSPEPAGEAVADAGPRGAGAGQRVRDENTRATLHSLRRDAPSAVATIRVWRREARAAVCKARRAGPGSASRIRGAGSPAQQRGWRLGSPSPSQRSHSVLSPRSPGRV